MPAMPAMPAMHLRRAHYPPPPPDPNLRRDPHLAAILTCPASLSLTCAAILTCPAVRRHPT